MEFNRRQRGRWEWRRALAVIMVCLLLVIGGSFLNNTLGRVVLLAVSPVLRFGNHLIVIIQSADSALRSKQTLVIENNKLKQRLIELTAALVDHQVLEADNQLLRQEIGLIQNQPEITVAEVVSHQWNSPFDIILAAVPKNSKIITGDQVTFKKNVWVGAVIDQIGSMVKIKLVSAPGSQVPVLIGSNNVSAMASGKGNGNLEVELPRNLEIRTGDSVMAGNTAAPLMVGTVGAVDNDPGESLQTILIRTPINLSFIHYLEIHGW